MHIKNIIISDFDYTIVEHDNQHFTAENLRAIKRWREKGNLFVIATGRGTTYGLSLALPNFYEYADYLIMNDGATIIKPTGEPLYKDKFSLKLVESLTSAINKTKFIDQHSVISYYGNRELNYIKPGCQKIRFWLKSDQDLETFEQLLKTFDRKVDYFIYRDTKLNFDARLPWIDKSLCHAVEILLRGTSKCSATRILLNLLDIYDNGRNITTIGDDVNDLEMIQAFNGYIPEHANPAIRDKIPSTHIVMHLHNLIAQKLSS